MVRTTAENKKKSVRIILRFLVAALGLMFAPYDICAAAVAPQKSFSSAEEAVKAAVAVRLESAIAAPDKVWAVAVLEIAPAPARGAAAELSRASIAAAVPRRARASAAALAGAALAVVVAPEAAAVVEEEAEDAQINRFQVNQDLEEWSVGKMN